MFRPRVALASLSGASDAAWARQGSPHAGAAFLGGIAVCSSTRRAANAMVARGRDEFLPADPIAFLDEQLSRLSDVDLVPGVNVRAVDPEGIARVATTCAQWGAITEINAHCRQAEMCEVGAGESLLRETDRLAEQVSIAAAAGSPVSVKVRAEVSGVDLATTSSRIASAGADIIHVDAMDSEEIIADVGGDDLFVIANNGVRDRESVGEYLAYGADAVSVGRPSDDPTVLARVHNALDAFESRRGDSVVDAG